MSNRIAAAAALLIAILVCGKASAQIIYEPVQYQYGDQNKYYYGGNDPRVHAYANFTRDGGGRWGRVHGFDFVSGSIDTHREVIGEPERVFADAVPFQNARLYGYTATDARNEAYSRIPTYFRKADLLTTAVPQADGSWHVPAQPVEGVMPYWASPRMTAPATAPTTAPRPIMIIPKKALEPAKAQPAGKLADAR
jgi:hypothetical protein